jgi:hypothetical protein
MVQVAIWLSEIFGLYAHLFEEPPEELQGQYHSLLGHNPALSQ